MNFTEQQSTEEIAVREILRRQKVTTADVGKCVEAYRAVVGVAGVVIVVVVAAVVVGVVVVVVVVVVVGGVVAVVVVPLVV